MKAKLIAFIGSTLDDLCDFPEDVRRRMGRALRAAQYDEHASSATPMHGDLRDVMEIAEDDSSGTYRVMYTVKLGDRVYVLHAFQKKSNRGVSTPKSELDTITKRLQTARKRHAQEG